MSEKAQVKEYLLLQEFPKPCNETDSSLKIHVSDISTTQLLVLANVVKHHDWDVHLKRSGTGITVLMQSN